MSDNCTHAGFFRFFLHVYLLMTHVCIILVGLIKMACLIRSVQIIACFLTFSGMDENICLYILRCKTWLKNSFLLCSSSLFERQPSKDTVCSMTHLPLNGVQLLIFTRLITGSGYISAIKQHQMNTFDLNLLKYRFNNLEDVHGVVQTFL